MYCLKEIWNQENHSFFQVRNNNLWATHTSHSPGWAHKKWDYSTKLSDEMQDFGSSIFQTFLLLCVSIELALLKEIQNCFNNLLYSDDISWTPITKQQLIRIESNARLKLQDWNDNNTLLLQLNYLIEPFVLEWYSMKVWRLRTLIHLLR